MTHTRLVGRIAAIADKPGDSEEERLRHRFLILAGVLMSGGGLLWGSLSIGNGLTYPSLIPFGYTAATIVNFTILSFTRRFGDARFFQVLISLLLPFFFQWSLGGFGASGAVMIWAMVALVGSFAFEDESAAARWLVVYLVLVAASAWFDGDLPVSEQLAASGLSSTIFGLNFGVVSSVVFGLTVFFVRSRQAAVRELAAKNEELEAMNAQIAASQQALIQSEKLAALGQLVAGVAHELNTPLGAIRASVGNIARASEGARSELPAVLAETTDAERAGLDRLVRAASRDVSPMTSREERAARRAIGAELEDADIAHADEIADTLVDIGLQGSVAPWLEWLRSPRAPDLLRCAYNLVSLGRNGENIALAAERASKIVFALKSYAHPGGADGESVQSRLADNLDTVLTLYHNQIKQGVDLVREYQVPGELSARHDQLNQVWTNLVHNALQASAQSGTLTVGVADEGPVFRVWVRDDGPGVPAAVRSRIFEPFFTTKAAGEGSGLGLSICREIVESHGGTITFESRPGETTFTVRLPKAGAHGESAI